MVVLLLWSIAELTYNCKNIYTSLWYLRFWTSCLGRDLLGPMGLSEDLEKVFFHTTQNFRRGTHLWGGRKGDCRQTSPWEGWIKGGTLWGVYCLKQSKLDISHKTPLPRKSPATYLHHKIWFDICFSTPIPSKESSLSAGGEPLWKCWRLPFWLPFLALWFLAAEVVTSKQAVETNF